MKFRTTITVIQEVEDSEMEMALEAQKNPNIHEKGNEGIKSWLSNFIVGDITVETELIEEELK